MLTDAQKHIVENVLATAYNGIPVNWLTSMRSGGSKAKVKANFADVHEAALAALAAAKINVETDIDFATREALHGIERISEGTDPRGGTFFDQAVSASASLASALARLVVQG